jgi:hypothetical protein
MREKHQSRRRAITTNVTLHEATVQLGLLVVDDEEGHARHVILVRALHRRCDLLFAVARLEDLSRQEPQTWTQLASD